jgi:hypothetical protein
MQKYFQPSRVNALSSINAERLRDLPVFRKFRTLPLLQRCKHLT